MANSITSNQSQGPPVSIPNHAVNKSTVNTIATSNRKPSITNDKQPTIPVQSVAPTTVPHPPKSVAVPAPSPDTPKPTVISPLATTYTDPLEHSLASLESDIIKSEPLENIVQLPPTVTNPICPSNPIKTEPLDGMVQMTPIVTTNPLNNPNVNSNPNLNPPVLQSGMGMDIKPSNIGLGNMLSTNNTTLLQGMHGNMDHDNMQQMVNSTNIINSTTNNGFNIKHEYDMPSNNNGLSSMGIPMNMSIPSMFDPIPQPVPKKEQQQSLLQPKPIEELTENVPNLLMDKKPTPPEQKHSQSFGFKPKQEQNVKNASSWSSLAQANNSPQSTASSGTNSRQQVMDSFKAFQNKAKEKLDREKQRLENLELKRQQKEQAEKERLRVENERRREKEEEDALEKAR